MSLLLAQSGHGDRAQRCPLLGVKRTSTTPRLSLLDEPVDDDKAKAEQIITIRIIRAGRDAWEGITEAETFDQWKLIGAGLAIGKAHALRVTGANQAAGQNYCREFSKWIKQYGFDSLPKGDRSYALQLHEHFGEIVAWRVTLSDRERNRLRSAQANVRRWQRATGQTRPRQCPDDLKVKAARCWRQFLSAMRALPPVERETLWHQSLAEMMAP